MWTYTVVGLGHFFWFVSMISNEEKLLCYNIQLCFRQQWASKFVATICVCPSPVFTRQCPHAQSQLHKETVFLL